MITFNATFGIEPGYNVPGHLHEAEARHIIGYAWRDAMENERKTSGILVSAVLTPSTVIYPVEFGCPPEGETAMVATGVLNPKFATGGSYTDFISRYKGAVLRVVEAVKDQLQQERVTLYFQEVVSFHYLEPAKETPSDKIRKAFPNLKEQIFPDLREDDGD